MSYTNYHSTQSFADYSFAIITGTLFFTFLIVGNFIPGLSHLLFLMFGFPFAVNAGIFSLGLGAIYRSLFHIIHPDLLARNATVQQLDNYIVENPGISAFVITVGLVFLTTAILTSVFHISLLAIVASHLPFLSSFSTLISNLTGFVTSALIEGAISSTLTAAVVGTILAVKTLFSTQTVQTAPVFTPSKAKPEEVVPPTPKATATNSPLKASHIRRSSSAPELTTSCTATQQTSESPTPLPTNPTSKLPTPNFAKMGPRAGAGGHVDATTPIKISANQVDDASSSEPTMPTSASHKPPRSSTSHKRSGSVGSDSPGVVQLVRIHMKPGESLDAALARHKKEIEANPFGHFSPVTEFGDSNPFDTAPSPISGSLSFGSLSSPVGSGQSSNPFPTPEALDDPTDSDRDAVFGDLSPLNTTPIAGGTKASDKRQMTRARSNPPSPIPFPNLDGDDDSFGLLSPVSPSCATQARQEQQQGSEEAATRLVPQ